MNLFDQDKTLKELIDVHRRYAGRQSEPDFLREENEITDKLVNQALRGYRIRVRLRHATLLGWWAVRLFLRHVVYPMRNKYRRFCAALRKIATREEHAQNAAVFGDDGELGAEARDVPRVGESHATDKPQHRHSRF